MGYKNDHQLYPQNIIPAPDITKWCWDFYWDDIGALDCVVFYAQLGFSAAGIEIPFYNEHQSYYTTNCI